MEEGGTIAEYLLIADESFGILLTYNLLNCFLAIVIHIAFFFRFFGFNDNSAPVFLVLEENVRSPESFFFVGIDSVASSDKYTGKECVIIVLMIIIIADGIP